MGTRNLTIVVKDGAYKVSQYGQWDGYPSGQGETIRKFLATANLDHFAAQIDKVRVLTEAELDARWATAGADGSGMVGMDVVDKFKKDGNAHLDRDMGAGILDYIDKAEKPEVRSNDVEFAGDSLFCEWAYVVNLDTRHLEVFKGFNTTQPLKEGDRFFDLQANAVKTWKQKNAERAAQGRRDDTIYYPVRLFASIPFVELDELTMARLEEQSSKEDGE